MTICATVLLAGYAHADIDNTGDLLLGGQAVIQGSMTVQAAAGMTASSATMTASGDNIYTLTLSSSIHLTGGGVKWADGSISTTASSGGSGTVPCPSGSVMVSSAGVTMGCIFQDENSYATWDDAQEYCYRNYGGRLPSASEWYVAAYSLALDSETDGWEWVGDQHGQYHCLIGETSIRDNTWTYDSSSFDFRCWIPR